MADLNLKINNRNYVVTCEDGQEEHVQQLADDIRRYVDSLVKAYGQLGEGRLLLMAGLMMMDELQNMRKKMQLAARTGGEVATEVPRAANGDDTEIVKVIHQLTQRMEKLASLLKSA